MTTLDTLALRTRHLYATGERRLGSGFRMAREATLLFSTCMASISREREVFARYMAMAKTHNSLAFFSIVQLQHVQAMMNLRQFVEAGPLAAHALAFPAFEVSHPETGLILPSQDLRTKAYRWVAAEFPAGSAEIKKVKDQLNANDAHMSLANSGRSFAITSEEMVFETPFFDEEDDYIQQTDLLAFTQATLTVLGLVREAGARFGGTIPARDLDDRYRRLVIDLDAHGRRLMNTDRYREAMTKIVER